MPAATPAVLAQPSPAEMRERLRRLIQSIEARPAPERLAPRPAPRRPLEEMLPGAWTRAASGLLTSTRTYELDHRHGAQSLADLRAASGSMLALLGRDQDLARRTPQDLLFLDIETTGLSGAGAMVFLVTTGRVESHRFVLRQYLAPSPAEEGALLSRLIAESGLLSESPVLTTYNGRAFDAPLLDQRATMHRLRGGFDSLDQLDLLATVRRGFRGLVTSCRLAHIEVTTLGVTRPPDEVAGAEVPAWYFRFLRTGDARYLVPLIAHNGSDVLSLAALTGRLAAVAAGTRRSTAPERLATARLWLAHGDLAEASSHFDAAAATLEDGWARDEALLALATLHRRAGRHGAAAAIWTQVAARPGAAHLHPLTELAKHHEHVARDLATALALVDHAIATVGETPALAHRRRRLLRKVERSLLRKHKP